MTPPITITARPGSDIWKNPPHTNTFNAPYSKPTTLPLSSFASARITFSGTWTEQFDQAGLLLVINPSSASSSASDPTLTLTQAPDNHPYEAGTSWIKAGLEYFNGKPRISFVGCDRWADWSVHPVYSADAGNVTIELVREEKESGAALWAYEVVKGKDGTEERYPFRECTWLWDQEGTKEVGVSAYVARQAEGKGDLKVEVGELSVVRR